MENELAFCLTCGECLGAVKPCYAQAHIDQFPDHRSFLTKTMVEPFALADIDSYIARLKDARARYWTRRNRAQGLDRTLEFLVYIIA